MTGYRSSGALILCVLLAICASARSAPPPLTAAHPAAPAVATVPPAQTLPEDPLGRSTPHGTVTGFLAAMAAGDSQRASSYLEDAPSAAPKADLARELRDVLDRATTLKLDDLSRERAGKLDDGLAPDLEQVGTAVQGDRSVPILLHLNTQKDAAPIWLFSSKTLSGIQDIADRLELSWGERFWPQSFRSVRFLSVPIFMWINNLLIMPLALAAAWLLARGVRLILRLVLRSVLRSWFDGQTEHTMARVARPVFLLCLALVIRLAGPLAATLRIRLMFFSVGATLGIAALAWLLVRMTQQAAESRMRRLRQAGTSGAIAATELYSWLVQCLWVVAGLFTVMRSLGINVSTALAGLGVGGLAVAFAAQKTIENLFGTVTVIGDQVIRVGDHCQAGNIDGRVESIGLRSTRIRTADRTLVSIPNGQLAQMNIGNLDLRDKFLYRHEIRLRYETTAVQLRQVLAQIRRMMADQPKVEPETLSVRLLRFGESSLDIAVQAHVLVRDSAVFLEIQEELLLRTLDIVEAGGTRMALPSRTTYLVKDPTAGTPSEGADIAT